MEKQSNARIQAIEERVTRYWSGRASDFARVRQNEMDNEVSRRWLEEITEKLPKKQGAKILDVGTGAGYFAIVLAGCGYELTGIDLTPEMIAQAKKLAEQKKVSVEFRVMDAQNLDFPDETFDAVIARNLTWTLPEPVRAYQEWQRVLKPGGVLLNYDACYGNSVRKEMTAQNDTENTAVPYGHLGITQEMERENAEITLSMEINEKARPDWDIQVLREIGFEKCRCDTSVGKRVIKDWDLKEAPLFGIYAWKREHDENRRICKKTSCDD